MYNHRKQELSHSHIMRAPCGPLWLCSGGPAIDYSSVGEHWFLSQSEWADWIHSAEGGRVQLQQQRDSGWEIGSSLRLSEWLNHLLFLNKLDHLYHNIRVSDACLMCNDNGSTSAWKSLFFFLIFGSCFAICSKFHKRSSDSCLDISLTKQNVNVSVVLYEQNRQCQKAWSSGHYVLSAPHCTTIHLRAAVWYFSLDRSGVCLAQWHLCRADACWHASCFATYPSPLALQHKQDKK